MSEGFAWLLYDASYLVCMTGMTLGFSLRIEGQGRIPLSGPVLIVANHQSFLDPVLVGLATRRHLRFLARKTLFRNRFFGRLIATFGAVPIDQEGVGKEGIKVILQRLEAGEAVVVFPEGARTLDGKLQPLKAGIHLLIKRTQAPIVPVGIAGAFDAWPRTRRWPVPAPLFLPAGKGTLAVAVGRPLDSRRLAELPREQALDALQQEMEKVFVRAERIRRKP